MKNKEYNDPHGWARAYVNDTLFYRHNYTGSDLNDNQRKALRLYADHIIQMANAGMDYEPHPTIKAPIAV